MSARAEDLFREADLPGEDAGALESFVDGLRALGEAEPPVPSPELAAMIARPSARPAGRSQRRVIALAAAATGFCGLTVTGVAAAANELPEPAQRLVATFSERYLPFEFPQPVESPDRGPLEDGDPAPIVTPTLPVPPEEGGTTVPSGPAEPSERTPEPSPQPSEAPTGTPTEPSQAPSAPPTATSEPTDGPTPTEGAATVPAEPEPTEAEPRVGSGSTDGTGGSASPDPSPATETPAGAPADAVEEPATEPSPGG